MTPTEVAPGVHRLGSEIVNWYLVRDGDHLTAVDAGLPRFRAGLESDLAALGASPKDVEAVVLTHSDSDHTGLAPAFRDAGARVLIHRDDAATLAKPGPKKGDASPVHLLPLLPRPRFWRFMGHMARGGGAKPEAIEGAETFSDGDALDVPGSPRVVATPGHTRGHSALIFPGHGALFVGDALCTWNPITGVRKPQLMPRQFNESNEACRESLGPIERLEAALVLPGHGDPWADTPAAAVRSAREALDGKR
jgi:glyoxylase-like metal-dependent hydrolase (beta-lactamase superfamily II)